jgi:hypothetical protein
MIIKSLGETEGRCSNLQWNGLDFAGLISPFERGLLHRGERSSQ